MEGMLTLREGDCIINLADEWLNVEQDDCGCIVNPIEAVYNVWKLNEKGRIGLQIYNFDSVATKGEAEAFAIVKGDWTLQMYRWKESGSYVVELWHRDFCLVSFEWWKNESGVSIYTVGEAKELIRFVQDTLEPKGENEQ
jgi:hypothetical protein